MQTESDLYRQSQEEITPIVDYIPLPDNLQLPESSRWRMKDQLDESRERPRTIHPSLESMQPLSSLRIQSRLNTDSAANDDKKTTSIMQGHSANTIPSNELSINVIRDNLKSCMTYRGRQENANNQSYLLCSNQNHSRNTEGQRWRSRSKETEASLHFMNQRSKLLRNIDRSLEVHKVTPEKERFQFKESKRERTKLLNEIIDKLDRTMKQKKEVELVKSNIQEHEPNQASKSEAPPAKKQAAPFTKNKKKWVETKNALKSAASESTQKCLSNSKVIQEHHRLQSAVSEWRVVAPEVEFESPTLISYPQLGNQIPVSTSSSSLFSAHKDFPSRRDDEIFTFSNLQGMPFQKHIKNVSITVSENSSKEFISNQMEPFVGECLLCKVIGKRCSFH